nr:MAG TPA: hypothetical protein [Caudoviricetes sp.]
MKLQIKSDVANQTSDYLLLLSCFLLIIVSLSIMHNLNVNNL